METNDQKTVTTKLWKILDLVRGAVDVSDYHLILYLLTLHRFGLLDKLQNIEAFDLKILINDRINKYEGRNAETLKELHKFYVDNIYDLEDELLHAIIREVQTIEKNTLELNSSEVFDDLLYRLYNVFGKLGGESILPEDVAKFICSFIDLPDFASVYNPFAGAASFGVFLKKNIFYYGQEINQATWAAGTLRLIAYNRENVNIFSCEDSISNWSNLPNIRTLNDTEKPDIFKYDLVISDPPFNFRLPQPVEGKFGKIRYIDQFVIERGLEILNPEGKLILILPPGLLFRSGTELNLRKFLVEHDLVDTIIEMPGGLLKNTSTPFAVLFISRCKGLEGKVRFINAAELFESSNNRDKIPGSGKLFATIDERESYVKFIANDEIRENEYNLIPSRYFINIQEGSPLKKVLTPMKGKGVPQIQQGKLVKIKNLSDDRLNYNLDTSSIEETNLSPKDRFIYKSCLLIASIGDKIKPTYFEFKGIPISISSNIYAFHINPEEVDLNYLINELYTESTIEQFRSFSVGSAMPRIKKEDFLSIKVDLPIKEEQTARIKKIREDLFRNKENELRLQKEILGLKDEAYREFASIKHTFRQYLNALKSNVSGTKKFISNSKGVNISLETIYSENLNRTLGEHLLGLEGTIDSMSQLLNSFENQVSSEQAIESDLVKLVEEAQDRFKNQEIFRFEKLYVDRESFAQFDGEYLNTSVYIHPEDFYRVFSNIISNAVEHGFKNKTGNVIRTSISFDKSNLLCVLEISNNGYPIPEGFTYTHLTTRGEKTTNSKGTGVGGADIKSIIDKYNGVFQIRNDKNDEFPVTYILGLPMVLFIL